MPFAQAFSLSFGCLALLGPSLAFASTKQTKSEEIRIAAAADLRFALEEASQAFAKKHPELKVKTTFGSSGLFYAQLRQNAPFDLYFSADVEYPEKLEKEGFAHPHSLFVYGIGRIALWTLKDSPIDLEQLGIKSLEHRSVRKIAIANPQHAPYGRAAVSALTSYDIYEKLRPKLVLGENISQAAQFVESKAAGIGIIALPLALSEPMQKKGKFWEIPNDKYPQMRQGGIITKQTKNLEGAMAFREFILSEEGKSILDKYGFRRAKDE